MPLPRLGRDLDCHLGAGVCYRPASGEKDERGRARTRTTCAFTQSPRVRFPQACLQVRNLFVNAHELRWSDACVIIANSIRPATANEEGHPEEEVCGRGSFQCTEHSHKNSSSKPAVESSRSTGSCLRPRCG